MKTASNKIAFTLTLFALVLTGSLFAQNPRGSLRGTVQDATGARIASAKIEAQLLGSSVQRQANSEDENGRGLQVVRQLSKRWGARRTPAGKVVWCEQPLPGIPGPSEDWQPLH